MSDKPTVVADWTPTGGDVVTPSAGEKSSGFQGQQRPPAQYVNWFWELITQWIIWINNGYFTRPSLTDNTPVLATTDRDGRVRNYLGPEGYWMGPAITRVYEPEDMVTYTGASGWFTIPSGLNVDLDANVNLYTASAAADNSPVYNLRVLSTASVNGVFIGRRLQHKNIDDIILVCEFRMSISAVGANEVAVWAGFKGNALSFQPGNNATQCGFEKQTIHTNWQLTASDGTAETSTDSGTPPVASTFQTFRLEYHGANTPVGVDNSTAPVVRYFIDGTEDGEESGANVPVTADGALQLAIVAEATGTGPPSDFDILVGPIRYAYNEVLSPDVPA